MVQQNMRTEEILQDISNQPRTENETTEEGD